MPVSPPWSRGCERAQFTHGLLNCATAPTGTKAQTWTRRLRLTPCQETAQRHHYNKIVDRTAKLLYVRVDCCEASSESNPFLAGRNQQFSYRVSCPVRGLRTFGLEPFWLALWDFCLSNRAIVNHRREYATVSISHTCFGFRS